MKECCVCFATYQNVVSLDELPDTYIEDYNLLFNCPCMIHCVCYTCLNYLVTNPSQINQDNSHIYCPYPFPECVNEHGSRYIFSHELLKKVCKHDTEWENFTAHANMHQFPGYVIVECPLTVRDYNLDAWPYARPCNSKVLVEYDTLRDTPIGELLITCDQNEKCLKRFCYNCKEGKSYFEAICYTCKENNETECPNAYNYFLNKSVNFKIQINDNSDIQGEIAPPLPYTEKEYLFRNKEITVELAFEQLYAILVDVNSYMLCPLCKISLYKTEKCNGMSHHFVERCYACGRIGYHYKGLGEHWNVDGVEGCYRFDYESIVRTLVPEYLCSEQYCTNHDKGDCHDPGHQEGITKLDNLRKRSYFYHAILSLPPNIRYTVYDKIFEICSNELLEFIPFKQTLLLVEAHKHRYKDYIEEIVYEQLDLYHPKDTKDLEYKSKMYTIPANEYVYLYKKDTPAVTQRHRNNNISAWRQMFTPLMLTNNAIEQVAPLNPPVIEHPVLTYNGYTMLQHSDTENEIEEDNESNSFS
jgi:hypothetical protein